MEHLDEIRHSIDCLILPELKHDLDVIPIEREHFKNYHEHLKTGLPLLFDFMQKEQQNFMWIDEPNNLKKQEVQARLIVLLCEISSPNSIFKLNETELVYNAERILKNFRPFSKEVDDLIFKYYEDKLHKDNWKKQIGAVHGFVQYLAFRFTTVSGLDQKMSHKFVMFCLSVALNIRSCSDSDYKNLSTSIFATMLRQGIKDDIVSMNIHGVIYDAVFKDICMIDSTFFIDHQWKCLLTCMDFYDNFDSFTWNYLDDMMEVLIRNISLAPDSDTSICLLKFVKKLTVYFTIDHKEFEEFYDKDLILIENMNECRSLANSNTSYTCYRWAKNILQMFVIESYKLMQTTEIAKNLLQEIHKIYILAILPIRLSIVEPHLIIFLEKFIVVLMETIKEHKNRQDVFKLITSLLETFYFHLQSSEGSAKLNIFRQNIYQLLKTEFFEEYASI